MHITVDHERRLTRYNRPTLKQEIMMPSAGTVREIGSLGDDSSTTSARNRSAVVWSFILGLLMAYYIDVGGQLYLTEVIAPLAVVFVARNRLGVPVSRLLPLGVLWLFSQVFTDLVRNIGPQILVGSALIVFTLVDIVLLAMVVGRDVARLRAVFAGYGIALAIGAVVQPSRFTELDPWKFGFALSFSFLGVAICSKWRPSGQLSFLSVLVLANVSLGFRSQALVLFLVIIVVLIPQVRLTFVARIIAVVVLIMGVVVADAAYGGLAERGVLGLAAQQKFDDQTRGSLGLLSGRGEVIYSALALKKSPVIGIGSDGADPGGVFAEGFEFERRIGSSVVYLRDRNGTVPEHSHLLGAWVQNGILALPLWILILAYLVRGVLLAQAARPDVRLLVAYACLNSGWDTLFSPLGATGRFQLAIGVVAAAMMIAVHSSEHKKVSELRRHMSKREREVAAR